PEETTEIVQFITSELGDLVEAVVPLSARRALERRSREDQDDRRAREALWKTDDDAGDDGNWAALDGALEQRFFQQARQLKRDGCTRALRTVVADARAAIEASQARSRAAADAARSGRDELLASARAFAAEGVL